MADYCLWVAVGGSIASLSVEIVTCLLLLLFARYPVSLGGFLAACLVDWLLLLLACLRACLLLLQEERLKQQG